MKGATALLLLAAAAGGAALLYAAGEKDAGEVKETEDLAVELARAMQACDHERLAELAKSPAAVDSGLAGEIQTAAQVLPTIPEGIRGAFCKLFRADVEYEAFQTIATALRAQNLPELADWVEQIGALWIEAVKTYGPQPQVRATYRGPVQRVI